MNREVQDTLVMLGICSSVLIVVAVVAIGVVMTDQPTPITSAIGSIEPASSRDPSSWDALCLGMNIYDVKRTLGPESFHRRYADAFVNGVEYIYEDPHASRKFDWLYGYSEYGAILVSERFIVIRIIRPGKCAPVSFAGHFPD